VDEPRPSVHLREIPIEGLPGALRAIGIASAGALARRLALRIHKHHALTWDDLELGRTYRRIVAAHFDFEPLLEPAGVRAATDGTRKFLFRVRGGHTVEVVFIRNRSNRTLCLSSQAGCAMGCTFCATGALGLERHLTAGEILESFTRVERETSERVTDIVFMGMGEPLHNYDAVMGACDVLNHDLGPCISRKRITVSTVGLTPAIRRFTRERRPWRLHLSLHSAVERTRRMLIPVARSNPLPELIDAMKTMQHELGRSWVTLQYVAIPGVNLDEEHVQALAEHLTGLRYILNVIPWNDTGAGYRAPTWAEVKAFTTALRTLDCPVKVRYSSGKQEGMGCGQLSAETVATSSTGGHMDAPPGVFSG
jgi:23S rRNA (adenine2503-C2)-methyltransferase